MAIIDRIVDVMDRFEAEGHRPMRLLLGHREAAEVEAALYRPAETWHGLFGEELGRDGEYAPKLPYPLTTPCTIFGVSVERVDQDTLLGVLAGDGEGE